MLYVAVDQHAKQLTVSVRDEAGDVVLRRQVSTEWERVRRFWGEIRERAADQGGFVVILEVCGFNDWLIALLKESQCSRIVLVQADERASTKTDRRDANRLGELLWVNRARLATGQRVPGLKRIVIPSKVDAENRQLTSMRQRIVAQRTKVINRLRHLLLKHNIAQGCPTKGIQTIKALKWLRELSLPEIDRLELDQCLAQWTLIEIQRKLLDQRIALRQEQDAQARLLATLPGGVGVQQPGVVIADRGCVAIYIGEKSVALLGINTALPELGREHGPAGIDHEGGLEDGAVHPRPARAACPEEGSLDAGVVSEGEGPARLEDRARGGHAAADRGDLEHAAASGALPVRWSRDRAWEAEVRNHE